MKLRRIPIVLFSAVCLWIQVKSNTKVKFPYGIDLTPPPVGVSPLKSRLLYDIFYYGSYVDWALDYAGWIAGLTTYWRMFETPPASVSQLKITAGMSDGSQLDFPFINREQRNFRQRNLDDFREMKHELNLRDNYNGLNELSQHLCHLYGNEELQMSAVRVELLSRKILAPREALEAGSYYGPEVRSPLGVFPCLTQ